MLKHATSVVTVQFKCLNPSAISGTLNNPITMLSTTKSHKKGVSFEIILQKGTEVVSLELNDAITWTDTPRFFCYTVELVESPDTGLLPDSAEISIVGDNIGLPKLNVNTSADIFERPIFIRAKTLPSEATSAVFKALVSVCGAEELVISDASNEMIKGVVLRQNKI